jgi:hypothetical protein
MKRIAICFFCFFLATAPLSARDSQTLAPNSQFESVSLSVEPDRYGGELALQADMLIKTLYRFRISELPYDQYFFLIKVLQNFLDNLLFLETGQFERILLPTFAYDELSPGDWDALQEAMTRARERRSPLHLLGQYFSAEELQNIERVAPESLAPGNALRMNLLGGLNRIILSGDFARSPELFASSLARKLSRVNFYPQDAKIVEYMPDADLEEFLSLLAHLLLEKSDRMLSILKEFDRSRFQLSDLQRLERELDVFLAPEIAGLDDNPFLLDAPVDIIRSIRDNTRTIRSIITRFYPLREILDELSSLVENLSGLRPMNVSSYRVLDLSNLLAKISLHLDEIRLLAYLQDTADLAPFIRNYKQATRQLDRFNRYPTAPEYLLLDRGLDAGLKQAEARNLLELVRSEILLPIKEVLKGYEKHSRVPLGDQTGNILDKIRRTQGHIRNLQSRLGLSRVRGMQSNPYPISNHFSRQLPFALEREGMIDVRDIAMLRMRLNLLPLATHTQDPLYLQQFLLDTLLPQIRARLIRVSTGSPSALKTSLPTTRPFDRLPDSPGRRILSRRKSDMAA